jgi:ribonuclease P protein component
MKAHSYNAKERLKSSNAIESLFEKGHVLKKFPFRLLWQETPFDLEQPVKATVAVSKRRMHAASSRNRMKRLMRESYRLNKHIVVEMCLRHSKGLNLMFTVTASTPLSYSETQEKIILLLQRLASLHGAPEPVPDPPDDIL